ncbi:MAG: bifunctional phosphoglucose/phosphomannose isomerase [Candidatus Moranbacteria bacterium]|nr:bifunctional phosphoglucose/phosphomannose isomerase [Candidatus Moranbacteria bacterium]
MENKIDASNMYKTILETAVQFDEGFSSAKNTQKIGRFGRVMISGMGGSALPGNLLRIYLNSLFGKKDKREKRIEVFQNRFYALPPEAYEDCLNFIVSYSGNTEETIASFQEAIDNRLPTVGFSRGGKIQEMCTKNNIPHVLLPFPSDDFQPRMALGYVFASMVEVLIKNDMIDDCRQDIRQTSRQLEEYVMKAQEKGKEIAQKIKGTTPIFYGSTRFKALAMIWKIKMNENAKTPAFWNFLPELNHNEMVGFTNPQAKFTIFILKDHDDHPRNLKRVDVLKEILEKRNITVEIVDMEQGSVLYKTFASITLGDWSSYYLALEYGQDPTPVDMVEDFKKELVK